MLRILETITSSLIARMAMIEERAYLIATEDLQDIRFLAGWTTIRVAADVTQMAAASDNPCLSSLI
jgi:hypothetical protein